LKIEYNSSLFPSFPEIRITVNGKNNIYDPRTGTYGFTSNWALICADVLTDTTYGLGDNTVNQAQLIAAANVCDEQVEVGALSTSTPSYESRYTTNWHYDTGVGSGDALAAMMPGAQGRLSRIGGEWYIWPAYWQGPSYSFDANALIAAPSWKPYRSTRDLFNRILGTYIAPSYPYNCVGNLYDSNGFYQQTQIQDNFPYAFQSTNYPEYACDTLHGYASDQYLTADGERKLPKEICYQTVLSITQAQRCSKIALLRNRQQGSGSLEMALGAYKMQPCDVMLFTFPQVGWSDKMLEIVGTSFKINSEDGQDGQKALSISTTINVVETEASVYEWSTTEELTVYDVPSTPTQQSSTPAPPTNMSLTSGAGTALIAPDGSLQSRIEVQWDTPLDVLATGIVVQYQAAPGGVATGAWMDAGTVSSALNLAYISGAVAGQTYNVRIASIRSNGVMSTWDEIDGYTVTLTLSSSTGLYRVGLGSLSGVAYPSAGAAIICNPFTAYLGQLQLPIFPGGAVTIGGLTQQTFYYVYYVDPVNSGGNVAPVATTNIADFLGKPGYWLIDSIVTPFAATGMASRYYPITSSDMGAASTLNITAAYDGNLSTYATMTAAWAGGSSPVAQCMAQFHFGAIILTTAATLTVVAACSNAGLFEVVAGWPVGTGYVDSTVMNATVVSGATTYTLTVPAGTNISNVTVIVQAGNSGNIGSGGLLGSGQVFELYIQT
jgi:hypothetical protein